MEDVLKKEEHLSDFEDHLKKLKDEMKSLQVRLGPLKKEQKSYQKKNLIKQIIGIEPKK